MNPREKRIEKAIEELTQIEKASLMVRHLSTGNMDALDQVRNAIPMRRYGPMLDWGTTHLFAGMKTAILFWAAEHWRCMLGFLAGLQSVADADSHQDEVGVNIQLDQVEITLECLAGLDGALRTFCEETGLDEEVVTRMTGAAPFWRLTDQLLEGLASLTGRLPSELRKTVDMRPIALLVSCAAADVVYQDRVETIMRGLLGNLPAQSTQPAASKDGDEMARTRRIYAEMERLEREQDDQ